MLVTNTTRSAVLSGGRGRTVRKGARSRTALTPARRRLGSVGTVLLAEARVNAWLRSIEVAFVDRSDPRVTTFGCREMGEIGIAAVAAAVANVYHATGRRVRDLRITPDKLL